MSGRRSKASARGECTAEEAGRRAESGERHAAVGDPKKLPRLVERRTEVRRLWEEFRASERHVCGLALWKTNSAIGRNGFRPVADQSLQALSALCTLAVNVQLDEHSLTLRIDRI